MYDLLLPLTTALLYLETGWVKWDYILLTEARTSDAATLLLTERRGSRALLLIKCVFVTLWPLMLAGAHLGNLWYQRRPQ